MIGQPLTTQELILKLNKIRSEFIDQTQTEMSEFERTMLAIQLQRNFYIANIWEAVYDVREELQNIQSAI